MIHDQSISMNACVVPSSLVYLISAMDICATQFSCCSVGLVRGSCVVCVVGLGVVCCCLWTEPLSRSRDRNSFDYFGCGIHLAMAVTPSIACSLAL
jgi:hypothetical protein